VGAFEAPGPLAAAPTATKEHGMATTLTPRRRVGHEDRAALGIDRRRALHVTLTQIERQFGRGAIWRLNHDQHLSPTPVIPTGSLPLDLALGVGGLPRGRITEIYGPEASGKTTLALSVLAHAQAAGGTGLFIDAEHALDLAYAKTVGVDTDRLLVCQPDCGEHALEVLETLIRSGGLDVAVVDSVPALVPRAELDGDIGGHYTGTYGRLMAQAMRKLAGAIAKTGTVVVFCNQLRDNPAILFGGLEVVPGGRALKHHAAVRLDLRRRDHLKDGGQVVGSRIRVTVVKSKVASPFRIAELDLRFDRGIDGEAGLLDLGIEHGLITKTGASFMFQETRLGYGREQAVASLRGHPDPVQDLERRLRIRFGLDLVLPNSPVRAVRTS
jgi:recombination protein RecA